MASLQTKSGPGFQIIGISEGETNWTPYVSASDEISGQELDFADDSLWFYEATRRSPDQIFNDQHLVHALMSSAEQSGINPVVQFKPAHGIAVYESITFKAGFHGQCRAGVMAVNGVDMIELEAWDRTPEEFTVNVSDIEGFSGVVESISIRQKELEPKSQVGAPALSYIKIDENQLLNGEKATIIEVAPGADWDQINIGSIIEQTEPEEVFGRVSEILPDENKIILSELHEGFVPGSEINVIVLDEDSAPSGGVESDDLLLVNRGSVDYCAKVSEVFPSVCELEALV